MSRLGAIVLVLSLMGLLVGCQSRPISNSGWGHNYNYRGELTELEVLGVVESEVISEDSIKQALARKGAVSLKRGDRLVVVQSGTQFPDDAMLEALKTSFTPVPVSGLPPEQQQVTAYHHMRGDKALEPVERAKTDLALRLAAARTGARTLLVYWGTLESGREPHGSKLISWVPVAGSFVPDEAQHMRIRLKAAVIDVESGYWEMLTPEAFENQRTSSSWGRAKRDQEQVSLLKEQAYERLAADLQTRYQ